MNLGNELIWNRISRHEIKKKIKTILEIKLVKLVATIMICNILRQLYWRVKYIVYRSKFEKPDLVCQIFFLITNFESVMVSTFFPKVL